MDELKIESAPLRLLVSQIIARKLRKKFGTDICVRLNGLRVSEGEEGRLTLHLDVEGSISKTELSKMILEAIG